MFEQRISVSFLERKFGHIGILLIFLLINAYICSKREANIPSGFNQAMKQAAGKFIGEYDFRNFCKMDAANVNNYRRRITFFDISPSKKRYA